MLITIIEYKKLTEEKDLEIKALKKRLSVQLNDAGNLQRKITSQETSLEQLLNRRHNLLQRCRVEEIELPRKQTGKKASGEGAEEEEEEGEAMQIDSGNRSGNSTYLQEDEEIKKLDFSEIRKKEVKDPRQWEKVNEKYVADIQSHTVEMDKLAPNLRAIARFEDVKTRAKETNDHFEEARTTASDAAKRFNELKQRR